MPVSYLSENVPNNPYVVPIDLGLLQKVNEYKQSQFYENADKLGTQFQQLNSLDIANGEQKQHANDVVNNLQTQINNMGGLDYSDPNVSNQISGYAGSVYNDKVILNGIISTKGIRTYDANTEKMKSDPKIAKYYSQAEEYFNKYAPADINPNSQTAYLQGGINATYNGPTAPAPYLGSTWDLLSKEITKINPNITTTFSPSGNRFFIDKTTNKEVTNSQIRQLVDGKIDGPLAHQIQADAVYNYYGLTNGTYSKEMGTQEFNKYNTDNLDRINNTITSLKNQITQEPDNLKRVDLEKQLQDENTIYLPEAQKAVTKGANDFSNLWDSSKSAAFYNLYTNKLKNDLSNVYSYSQKQEQLIVDQEQVANTHIDLEAAKLGATVVRNTDGSFRFVGGRVKGGKADPNATGPDLTGDLQRDFSSADDLAKKEVNQTTIQKDIDDKNNEINGSLRDIIFKDAAVNNIPGLFPDGESINNDPNANPVSHPDLLRQIGQLSGNRAQLEKSDIDNVVHTAQQQGSFDAKGNFISNNPKANSFDISQGSKKIVTLTAPQITYFKKLQGIMDDAANGVDINGRVSNAGEWRTFMNNYSIGQSAIINKQTLLKTARDQVYNNELPKYGLNPKEIDAVKDYVTNPDKYNSGQLDRIMEGPGGVKIPVHDVGKLSNMTPTLASGFYKIISNGGIGTMSNLNDQVNGLLNNTANRPNYYSILFPDSIKDLGDAYDKIQNYVETSSSFSSDVVNKKENLDITNIVTDGDQYYIKYGDRNNLKGTKGYIPISEANLDAFGIPRVPYPALEQIGSQFGHLPQPIYIDPLATSNSFNNANKFTGPVKIDIKNMNASGDRNNDNFTPGIVYNGKTYLYKNGNSRTMNAALQYITQFIQNNQTYTNLNDMVLGPNGINNHNQK